jgi:MYXO-CTERM domain-containing protein
MSEYILDPGARLDLGPGGTPYEELGACCASCAKGATRCSRGGLGADKSSVLTAGGGGTIVIPGGAISPTSSSSALPMILGLGAVGVVGFFAVRWIRRRRRHHH